MAAGREPQIGFVRPEPGNTFQCQAIGGKVQEVTDHQASESDAHAGGDKAAAGVEASGQGLAGVPEADIVEGKAERVLGGPDNRADHRETEQAVEEGAVSCEMLDALADGAKALAKRAA